MAVMDDTGRRIVSAFRAAGHRVQLRYDLALVIDGGVVIRRELWSDADRLAAALEVAWAELERRRLGARLQ